MERLELDFLALLGTLAEFEVEFIVVGGVSAVLQGAPIATFDLDILHRRTAENVERLLAALNSLHARYRGQGERSLQPERSHLLSEGHQLLLTNKGPLDVLGQIGKSRDYENLLGQTTIMEMGNFTVRVLDLKTLIQIKEETGQLKDLAMLPILRETLNES